MGGRPPGRVEFRRQETLDVGAHRQAPAVSHLREHRTALRDQGSTLLWIVRPDPERLKGEYGGRRVDVPGAAEGSNRGLEERRGARDVAEPGREEASGAR